MEKIFARFEKRRGERVICGDLNIAHTQKDIRNWRGNLKNSGFLPEEREWLTRFLAMRAMSMFSPLERQRRRIHLVVESRSGARKQCRLAH